MSSHRARRKQDLHVLLQQWKMRLLLVALVLAIIAYPFLQGSVEGYLALAILFSVVLLAGVYVVSHHKRNLVIGLAFGVPAIAANWLRFFSPSPEVIALNHVFSILFYAFIVYALLRGVLTSKKVTSDVLYGAVAVYLLLAITWGWVYSLLEFLMPGSFTIFVGPNAGGKPVWADLVYFSFTTLTSIGFADILPITYFSRSFAILETVMGVLYITVLIGRLVGMYSGEAAEAAAEKVEEFEEKRGR